MRIIGETWIRTTVPLHPDSCRMESRVNTEQFMKLARQMEQEFSSLLTGMLAGEKSNLSDFGRDNQSLLFGDLNMKKMPYTPPSFSGIKIIEDPNLTEPGEPYEVRRTWKERLLSLPWQPFRRMKTIVPQVPMKQVLLFKGNTFIAHPVVAAELRRKLQESPYAMP
jgi:hypothetical protein